MFRAGTRDERVLFYAIETEKHEILTGVVFWQY